MRARIAVGIAYGQARRCIAMTGTFDTCALGVVARTKDSRERYRERERAARRGFSFLESGRSEFAEESAKVDGLFLFWSPESSVCICVCVCVEKRDLLGCWLGADVRRADDSRGL